MSAVGDYLTSDVCYALMGDTQQGTAYAVEVKDLYRGVTFWSTIIVAHRPTVYRTLEEARKKKSYIRSYDRKWRTTPRQTRIVKITVTREII
jgi:hypothetical protein